MLGLSLLQTREPPVTTYIRQEPTDNRYCQRGQKVGAIHRATSTNQRPVDKRYCQVEQKVDYQGFPDSLPKAGPPSEENDFM